MNRSQFQPAGLRLTAVFAAALQAAACAAVPAGAAPEAPDRDRAPDRAGAPASPDRGNADIEELFWARADSARARYTAADADFMTGMIVHHAQALLMTGLVEGRAASRSVETLAARIANAQQDEIFAMQQWLRERGLSAPEIHIAGTELMVHGAGDHTMHGAGMLTDTQLRQLAAASGGDFDRLFLEFMIEHHRGAIAMVTALLETDGAGQDPAVFKLASDIQVDQVTEITRMEQMLAQLQPRDAAH